MDFEIRPHTILLTRAGSRAYGTNTETSDLDLKGVAIAPKRYYLGCGASFEQADSPEHAAKFKDLAPPEETKNGIEGTIYELKKCLQLLMQNNPSLLDVLYCRDQDILLATKFGERLRASRDLFLSTKCRWAYSGYSIQQLKKIKSHRRFLTNPIHAEPKRVDFGLPESYPKSKYDVAFDMIQKKLDGWRFNLTGLDDADRIHIMNTISDYLAELLITSDEEWHCAGRAVGLTDELMAMLDKERKFRSAQKEWKAYNEWKKNRNPERAELEAKFGYDCKFAMQLVRLLKQCREILTTGKVNVWRGNIDADELQAIRNGAWSYEKLLEFAEREDKALGQIYDEGQVKLPHSPDAAAIDRLCQEILEEALQIY